MKRRLEQILADVVWWMLLFTLRQAVARTIGNDPVVETRLGKLRGVAMEFQGMQVSAFLGVPYARPPTETRRFSKPVPVQSWSGELKVQAPAKACYLTPDTAYPGFRGAEMWNPANGFSEDCLNMNIWVPEKHSGSVLVWIYGGGFFSGSPSLELYNGTAIAALKHTIVVNINYRLGPFGFLYLGRDSSAPGNMGLLDQQAALRWIHENIEFFGGDPSKVTLFGESAGAASVTSHMFAPDSYSFFNKIIASSGSILNFWSTQTPETMYKLSMRLAERVNCTIGRTSTAAIHNCLRTLPARVIQDAADAAFGDCQPMTFPFVPISSDVNFFKGDVFERLQSGNFMKNVSALVGSVKDEGTYWLPYYLPHHGFLFNHEIPAEDPQNQALINESQYKDSLREFMPYFRNLPTIEKTLLKAYRRVSDRRTKPERLRDGVGRFIGDFCFTCSLIEFADAIADQIDGPVYMYYFTMRSTANPWPKWMGVMHGYEIEYAFGQPISRPSLYDKNYLKTEQSFSKHVLQLWSDFYTNGNPATYWPTYNKTKRTALVLGEESTRGINRIMIDVHGIECKLMKKWKAIAKDKLKQYSFSVTQVKR